MTTWLPWILLLLGMIAFFLKHFFSRVKSSATNEPVISNVKYRYRCRKSLCTANELSFLQVLEAAAGSSMRVYSKVHASHILIPRSELSIENWNLSFERVVSKQFDYVICSATDLTILCIVMLATEKSTKNPGYRFIIKACRSAGLPVINLAAEKEYAPSRIRHLLKKHIPDAFPKASHPAVSTMVKERREKLKLVQQTTDSLQVMLLEEGRRRAKKLKQHKSAKTKSS